MKSEFKIVDLLMLSLLQNEKSKNIVLPTIPNDDEKASSKSYIFINLILKKM